MRKLRPIELAKSHYLVNGRPEIWPLVWFQSPNHPNHIDVLSLQTYSTHAHTHIHPSTLLLLYAMASSSFSIVYTFIVFMFLLYASFSFWTIPTQNHSHHSTETVLPKGQLAKPVVFRRFTSFCPMVSDIITSTSWKLIYKTTLFSILKNTSISLATYSSCSCQQ